MNSELSMNQALIEKLTKILEVNLDKEHFGVKELAKEANLSRSQLHRKLISISGMSTSRFIRNYRLKKAMAMLQDNSATASEIAYRVGFSSPTYFNSCFHDYYGYPPGEVKLRNPKILKDDDISENLKLADETKATSETSLVKKHPLRHRMVWINTFFIVLLGVISYTLYQNYKDTFTSELGLIITSEKSIAILPFKNLSNQKENQYFADGVAGSILNNLSKISDLKVIPSSSMEKYRNSNLSPLKIAKEVGVIYLLEGSIQKHSDSIRVITNLVHAERNEQLQSFVFDWEFKHIFDIQTKIALEIAKQLDMAIDPDKLETIKTPPTKNIEAYNLYLKGRFFWQRRTEEDLSKSIHYFKQAIILDSIYALAYAGLADAYYVMPFHVKVDRDSLFNLSKKYAEKALSLDYNNAAAHATLGSLLCYKDRDWEASEKELKLAIKLDPNYATGHHFYFDLLNTLGRNKEARKEIDLALKLNPNSYMMHIGSAYLHMNEGLFENAILEANMAKELNKDKFELGPDTVIMDCYKFMGMEDQAIAAWEESVKLNPNPDLELNIGRRHAFEKYGLKGFYKFTNDHWLKTGAAYKNPVKMAQNYAYLGETEKVLTWLELAYEDHDFDIINIKNDYAFNNLRHEPRFLALLKKLNLGDYE